ncbi:patatin-like phospholipase family protein [Deinococcus sp. YIM 134068]|uniref:patatin-like phospholipase family protein n=1 Tax=Deinococcus lichenicola TaxID=3118910 RepID=UPI002F95AD6F
MIPPTATPPLPEADLVMQGGVTSGVVYPPVVCELARTFRFRRVGGTSAGAISAALLAAAELRRQDLITAKDPHPLRPFETLHALGTRLAAPLHPDQPDGPRVLEGLFAPDEATAPLFEALRGGLRGDARAALRPLLRELGARPHAARAREVLRAPGVLALLARRAEAGGWAEEVRPLLGDEVPDSALSRLAGHPVGAGVAVLLGSALLAWGSFRLAVLLLPAEIAAVLAALVPLVVLGVLAGQLARRALASLREAAPLLLGAARAGLHGAHATLVDNGFGLATGYGGGEPSRLTPWLHRELQALAGRPGGVLTFGDLRERDVELKLVSTCLTRQRPYVLPLNQRSADHKDFYFRPDEWGRFFPPEVLAHLTAHAERMYLDPGLAPPPGREGWTYYRLPPEEHLPVLVATRLSMSFPGLFSALPLYFLQWGRRDEQLSHPDFRPMWSRRFGGDGLPPDRWKDHERRVRVLPCLFSDGGLTSNFPLMLFDEVIPERPLFAVRLQTRRTDHPAFLAGPLPWQPFHQPTRSVPEFAVSLVESARHWFDSSLLTLPGYAERVVSVTLPRGVGGLNLGMDADRIRWLLDKGTDAGRRLAQRFGPDSDDPRNTAGLTAARWPNVTADLGELLVAYARQYPSHTPPTSLTPEERDALAALIRTAGLIRQAVRADPDALFPAATPWNKVSFRQVRGLLRYRPFL